MASKTIIAAGVGIALGGLVYMAYKSTLPRGVRNNNPLNIRESKGDKTQWKGEALFNTDKACLLLCTVRALNEVLCQ